MRTSIVALALLAGLTAASCASEVVVGTGLRYTPMSRAAVVSGGRMAGCVMGRTAEAQGVWLSCPTPRGYMRNIKFVNDGGAMVAICYDRTPEGCSRYAQRILAGAGPVRVVIIRR